MLLYLVVLVFIQFIVAVVDYSVFGRLLFIVVSLLLAFISDEDAAMWKGFLFCSLLFLLSCLQSLLHHQYMFHCFSVGMRLKTALIGLVYRKVRHLVPEGETPGTGR